MGGGEGPEGEGGRSKGKGRVAALESTGGGQGGRVSEAWRFCCILLGTAVRGELIS